MMDIRYVFNSSLLLERKLLRNSKADEESLHFADLARLLSQIDSKKVRSLDYQALRSIPNIEIASMRLTITRA